MIRPFVFLFFAAFFLVVVVVNLATGDQVAGSVVLALIFGVPGVWVTAHPWLIRRRMARASPGGTGQRPGSRVPVTVEVAEVGPGALTSGFVQQSTVLRLRGTDGLPWLARLRPGSVGGRYWTKRGNPWVVPPEAGQTSSAQVPGELVMPTGRAGRRLGLILHRPAGAPLRPMQAPKGFGSRELIFGCDPGECVGLYIWRHLVPDER